MNKLLNYIKQNEKVFGITSAICEFLIYLFTGALCLVHFINDHNLNDLFLCIIMLLCSVVFPIKLAIETHRGKKVFPDFFWIPKFVLTLLVLVTSFVFMPEMGDYLIIIIAEIVFFVFSCAKLFCLEIKKVKYTWLDIFLRTMTMISIVTISANFGYWVPYGGTVYMILSIVIGVLEMVYSALVCAGIARWVCPNCQRFNKVKANFCVGCGKPRPAEPKPLKKPHPAPAEFQPTDAALQSQAADISSSDSHLFCDGCGAPIQPGTVFCGQCGKPLR